MNNLENIYTDLHILPRDEQGWNGNSIVFRDLINELKPNTIIEVGSWKGQSSINMGLCLKANGIPGKIYCVDTWLGAAEFWNELAHTPERDLLLKNGYPQIFYQFLSNVVHNNLQDIIIPFPNTSLIGAKYLKYNKITSNLIYIDASHEELDVYNDLVAYYDLLQPGGVMFGDDFHAWPGVYAAVNRFARENEFDITIQILESNFWILRKK